MNGDERGSVIYFQSALIGIHRRLNDFRVFFSILVD